MSPVFQTQMSAAADPIRIPDRPPARLAGAPVPVIPILETPMPRYFIDTADHVAVRDDEGTVLPDRAALRDLLRRTLTALLHDEGEETGVNDFTARAYDEDGRLVMRARASFHVVDP